MKLLALSLVKQLEDFESETHDAEALFAKDLIDEKLVEKLITYNEGFEKLTKAQLKNMVLIQSQLLIQLGLYDDEESESPLQLAAIVPKSKPKLKKRISKAKSYKNIAQMAIDL